MMICIEKDKNDRLVFMVKDDQSGSRILGIRPRFMRRLADELTAYLFESDVRPVETDLALKNAIDMVHSAQSV